MRGVDKNPFSWYNTSVKRIREVNKMKNAKEIREITNKVLEERNALAIKKMNDYIDEVIAPQQGLEVLTVDVDVTRVVGLSELAKVLVANGYEVGFGVKYPMIKIRW